MKRRALVQAASAAAVLPAQFIASAFAQAAYPNKPITLICPYAAAGNADQRSRQLGRFLSTALGQPVIVDNKPGAGGNIGTEVIARAKPDGYTIGMGNFGPMAVNVHMFAKLNYDPIKDLTPICLIERGPLVLMVPANSPFKNVKDIIAKAKAEPGKLSFASGGLGGSHHLSGEMFKSLAGLNMTHIPYKGGAPATTDLMGGQVDLMFEQMYTAAPSIRSGKLRALAITSKTRSPLFPEIPTMIESGVPNFEVLNWQGLVGPAGMPAPLVTLLNDAVNKALADPTIKEQMLTQGNELGGGTPQVFASLIAAESQRWGKIVKENNVKPE
ncbi:MAG: tripartite tricarboxylate transporter substrate binding protein [Vitreoscilla sp.]|nr:tripartite tricarboxylate transporter substrate binding protein [Polaromonas sp.]